MTMFTSIHMGILVGIYFYFGITAVWFQLGYSAVGIFFIELINYVEHYGLVRVKD
jgi:alkane 1-monooxygenase